MSWFNKGSVAEGGNEDFLRAKIVDQVSVAIMTVDRDFMVTYVNQPTRDLLSKNAEAFRSIWPNFDPEKIIGTCIDTFHRNPAHQRKILSDPKNLPFRTEITIGDLKVTLLVNGCFDRQGNYVGNVLEWMDVTASRLNEGMLAAINRSQAVIEFSTDGRIQHANENFLKAVGYSLDEIRGKHHSIFVEPAYRESADYRAFWEKLGRGEYDAGQYKRFGKGAKEIWIQASYNPILDMNGKAFKVVKYATDITGDKEIEAGIRSIVEAAADGDFSQRVETEGKVSSLVKTGEAVNSLSGTIAKALDDLIRMLSALADGDLTQRIDAEYNGSFGTLKNDANTMAERIGSTITEIMAAAREVTNASAEISTSTTDLSQRTEEQAASLEETSASMEEIATTVKKNAENAQQANQQATGTQEVADRGGQVVAKAVEAMARIEESSRKISDIIGVIDEIARQTNLLALNAAVEAARAGDAGRGFAVVASEVRSLAQRSSQAAKDIKDLITNSSAQVKDGVDLVNRAGASLHEIVDSIKKVAGIVSDIAAASAEQSTGIEQVNKALAQMDEVTQQNSALVEENAATAKTLEQQAKSMDSRVSFFRVDAKADEEPEQAREVRKEKSQVLPVRRTNGAGKPAATPRRANGANPVGRMQGALATALRADEWEEF
ncbi:MAG: PAS domain S-box protein [Xanthobacteraceae bacterium]|nr:PAS domain S-box protein [Xanthobacteraceae bacterium]QYK44175.1 MAG: PAS domain S-box protein [Xanthobacteraceae bacterium]